MKAIFIGGKYSGLEIDVKKIVGEWSNEIVGYSIDYSDGRKVGGCVHRKELDNQPLIRGYLSPMWDGCKLRYETQKVYDVLCK